MRVIYFFVIILDEVGKYYYGEDHPMKPYRIRLAH